jgi:hemerythrin superfamily protein
LCRAGRSLRAAAGRFGRIKAISTAKPAGMRVALAVLVMDAIELLTTQHRQMEAALERALAAEGQERGARLQQAADVLMSHVLIEERLFYPAVKERRTEDILLESLEEHLSIKRLIADLVELPVTDEHFEAKLHVLKEQTEHHHEEEEGHLFPKVKKLLSGDELAELGKQMQAMQAALLANQPRELAAQQTDAAAEL